MYAYRWITYCYFTLLKTVTEIRVHTHKAIEVLTSYIVSSSLQALQVKGLASLLPFPIPCHILMLVSPSVRVPIARDQSSLERAQRA